MDGAASPRQRRAPAVAVLLMLLMVSAQACWSPSWGTAPAEPAGSSGVGQNRVAAADLGERLNVTAIVEAVLAERAFVIRDTQLPHGLLVLEPTAADVSPTDVVAVYGTVRQFNFDEFRAPFELPDRAPYQPYEGLKVLVAAEVRPLA